MRDIIEIELPQSSIGNRRKLIYYHYKPENLNPLTKRAYLQASLHADELPGLLLNHHLIKLLDEADNKGEILEEIIIVPYANPIGLSQRFFGMHQGRFSLDSAINFNRDYVDLENLITSKIEKDLKLDDENHNVMIIRKAMIDAINEDAAIDEEAVMKKELLKLACISDIALDLHCDSEALLYMFTHDLLWPQLSDLAAEIGSEVQLLSGLSGGNPFDEALSCPWQTLKEKFKDYPIPMACQSATIELRGEKDVCHEFAKKDSIAFHRFLQRRGYIAGGNNLSIPLPNLIRDASPLTGVEMIFCNKPGIVCLNVKIGDIVNEGDVLGEVIDIENPYAPTQELKCRTSGIIFSIFNHKLCKPGTFILKVAGEKPLPWRKGKLLTL
jgi:predicted deacylase